MVLLLFSVADAVSLRNTARVWLPEIRHFCPRAPIILCGTKNDLRYADLEALLKERGPVRCVFICLKFRLMYFLSNINPLVVKNNFVYAITVKRNYLRLNKDKLTRARFEPMTLFQQSYLALWWQSPDCVNIFVRRGLSARDHTQAFDTTLKAAARGPP